MIKVQILERDVAITALVRKHLERRLGFVLARFAERIGRVTVRFSPAHGPLKRCQIAVGLRPRTVEAEDTDADLFAAVDHASDRLSRSIARLLEGENGWPAPASAAAVPARQRKKGP